jgi:hypothetical protein
MRREDTYSAAKSQNTCKQQSTVQPTTNTFPRLCNLAWENAFFCAGEFLNSYILALLTLKVLQFWQVCVSSEKYLLFYFREQCLFPVVQAQVPFLSIRI